MSDKDTSKSLGFDLNVLEEAKRMKDNGASNTQLRAYLEEHGMSDIVFHNDDVGINPGIPADLFPRGHPDSISDPLMFAGVINEGYDIGKAITNFIKVAAENREPVAIDIERSVMIPVDIHLATPLDQLNMTTDAVLQRYDEIASNFSPLGIPSEKLQLLGPDRNKAAAFDFDRPLLSRMPNKSVGESEMGSGLRGVYFPEHSLEENLGMKLPDELAERLRNTDLSQAPSPASEEFSVIYAKEAMARRRYKAIILSINLKLKKGPLAEFVYIKGIRKINPHTYVVECAYPQGKTFRAMNRMKTFRPYLGDIVYFAYFDHLTTEEHLAIREIRYT